jgi:hypothetical protein
MVNPISEKMKIVIGNHDDTTPAKLLQYMRHFGLSSQYYSFNYQNVHFLAMSTEPAADNGSSQYNFVQNDLAGASSNKSINWIVVYFHKPIYGSPSAHPSLISFRELYHPLFDKYGVDLVLYGHNHTYERTFPLQYNTTKPSKPVITDGSEQLYDETNRDAQHPIFITVGTAGKSIHGFSGKAPYVESQYKGFGFLDVQLTDNGKTMKGAFHANDGTIKDRFTIEK